MSYGLTQQQSHLLGFIKRFSADNGFSPSYRQMMAALELKSVSGASRLVDALEERGFIHRMRDRARAIEVVDTNELAKFSTMDLRRELMRRQEGPRA